jgi:hypothetical protein
MLQMLMDKHSAIDNLIGKLQSNQFEMEVCCMPLAGQYFAVRSPTLYIDSLLLKQNFITVGV